MKASRWHLPLALALCLVTVSAARAELVLLGQFRAQDLGLLIGVGFDRLTDTVWAYGTGSTSLRGYSRTGVQVASVPRPGEFADDADLDAASATLSLGGTIIPAGILLFTNGESGTADIYAVDPATGTVIAGVATTFGLSHVVGGSYHPGRGTVFLVQDRLPPGTVDDSKVAEVDPANGNVLNAFQIPAPFSIFYGDVEVSAATGNLFVVSSEESSIREITPTGTVVRDWALPAGVSSLSGIALDDARGEAWVSGTGGTIWRLGGLPATGAEPLPPAPPTGLVLTVTSPVAPGGAATWSWTSPEDTAFTLFATDGPGLGGPLPLGTFGCCQAALVVPGTVPHGTYGTQLVGSPSGMVSNRAEIIVRPLPITLSATTPLAPGDTATWSWDNPNGDTAFTLFVISGPGIANPIALATVPCCSAVFLVPPGIAAGSYRTQLVALPSQLISNPAPVTVQGQR
jgi:hypothetical protein